VRARPRSAALAALLCLCGCSLLKASPQPPTTEGEWAKERDAATRRGLLYDRFDHVATATATLITPEVREARARRLAEWFGWTPAELDKRLEQERRAAAQGEEFFLSLYTSQSSDNDLDAPRSIWRIAVKVDGVDVLPKNVKGAEKNANDLVTFPYVGHFDVTYRVFLPTPPGGSLAGRKFVLEISSAKGKLTLDWGDPRSAGPYTPADSVPPS
jgi:hypothetical protein